MKEPQFKAWHKDKKCWVSICPQTGYGLDLDNGQIYYNGLNITERIDLFQFTGLRDNKGKKIYEGNIVRVTDRRHNGQDIHYIGVVKYITRSCWFAIEYRNLAGDIVYLNINILPTEIIGHVCENSELLEGENEKSEI